LRARGSRTTGPLPKDTQDHKRLGDTGEGERGVKKCLRFLLLHLELIVDRPEGRNDEGRRRRRRRGRRRRRRQDLGTTLFPPDPTSCRVRTPNPVNPAALGQSQQG